MKRILVIDDSEVIRETLALILGREFAVTKRPLGARGFPVAAAHEEVDLLILGVTPQLGRETAALLRFAGQLPFAVLLLVESKTVARAIQEETEIGCLTKPFNPYELHAQVGRLLARRAVLERPGNLVARTGHGKDFSPYLDFPWLTRSASLLAQRFVASRLPLLILGEIGCGQDDVVSGICELGGPAGLRLTVRAAEASAASLSQIRQELALEAQLAPASTTLVIENLDRCSEAGQSLLLNFLGEVENSAAGIRYLTTANADLLERVYRGELLESLYYKLATLTLKLPPLRERLGDIPALADWFAGECAKKIGLPEPVLLPDAYVRLKNYLWFGNLREMETVVARTLAFHRKSRIAGADLIFDFSPFPEVRPQEEGADFPTGVAAADQTIVKPTLEIYRGARASNVASNGRTKTVELKALIHELAHELKNPMVTIKTFAQLLGDRYQDENFRSRFQEIVGSDIERMDELLEVMIEFADFAQPQFSKVSLGERLRPVLAELHGDCAKRQTRFEWSGDGAPATIQVDDSQLDYILKNVLWMVLSDARMGSEIVIDTSTQGSLVIRYLRESPRVASITHYLKEAGSEMKENSLPLRVLLAKYLLERNDGRFLIDESDNEKETLRLEFPIAEH